MVWLGKAICLPPYLCMAQLRIFSFFQRTVSRNRPRIKESQMPNSWSFWILFSGTIVNSIFIINYKITLEKIPNLNLTNPPISTTKFLKLSFYCCLDGKVINVVCLARKKKRAQQRGKTVNNLARRSRPTVRAGAIWLLVRTRMRRLRLRHLWFRKRGADSSSTIWHLNTILFGTVQQ